MDNETYAAVVAYMKAHGGGGGTSDYEQLSNQPQINGHTLTGNQTSADLELTTVTITGDALVLS